MDPFIRHLAGNKTRANAFLANYYDRFRDLDRDNPTPVLHMWLREHSDNPSPSKAEKMMLAIVTKMALRQVDTWFYYTLKRMQKNGLLGAEERVSIRRIEL